MTTPTTLKEAAQLPAFTIQKEDASPQFAVSFQEDTRDTSKPIVLKATFATEGSRIVVEGPAAKAIENAVTHIAHTEDINHEKVIQTLATDAVRNVGGSVCLFNACPK